MGFTVPSFNLPVNIWRHGLVHTLPPSVVTVGNLAWGRRAASPSVVAQTSTSAQALAPVLLLPALTDIRDNFAPGNADTVEVPAGSGRFYSVTYVEDIGKGFPNEHRGAVLEKFGLWPVPYP